MNSPYIMSYLIACKHIYAKPTATLAAMEARYSVILQCSMAVAWAARCGASGGAGAGGAGASALLTSGGGGWVEGGQQDDTVMQNNFLYFL